MGGDEVTIIDKRIDRISIHASRVGGDLPFMRYIVDLVISIHASRVGGDIQGLQRRQNRNHFNPRLPGGRRPDHAVHHASCLNISIHASRVGGDRIRRCATAPTPYFNPRLPGGRRLP